MKESLRRPWKKRAPGPSLLGISLLIAAVCVFGYGIVQQGLVASSHDQRSAELWEESDRLRALADVTTNPYEYQQLSQRAFESDREAMRELGRHGERVETHTWLIIIGIVLSIAGVIILIVHRRHSRNIV